MCLCVQKTLMNMFMLFFLLHVIRNVYHSKAVWSVDMCPEYTQHSAFNVC